MPLVVVPTGSHSGRVVPPEPVLAWWKEWEGERERVSEREREREREKERESAGRGLPS